MIDVIEGEVYSKAPTLEEVNNNLLSKLNELIKDASPDNILDITESMAKFNASVRNNEIFTPPETEMEARARHTAEGVASILGKEK